MNHDDWDFAVEELSKFHDDRSYSPVQAVIGLLTSDIVRNYANCRLSDKLAQIAESGLCPVAIQEATPQSIPAEVARKLFYPQIVYDIKDPRVLASGYWGIWLRPGINLGNRNEEKLVLLSEVFSECDRSLTSNILLLQKFGELLAKFGNELNLPAEFYTTRRIERSYRINHSVELACRLLATNGRDDEICTHFTGEAVAFELESQSVRYKEGSKTLHFFKIFDVRIATFKLLRKLTYNSSSGSNSDDAFAEFWLEMRKNSRITHQDIAEAWKRRHPNESRTIEQLRSKSENEVARQRRLSQK